ncbi:hypothetical protein BCV70DRAFT_6669 [Testicularia cyperi]|uniref:Uncharacterized protein n=1 Tax=Testicularia cyperi TaxID=1882483 RepID=A0A317XZL8_9BASI|nr:hypothetical protein BCV70DRAFT_6669 [Testicularia cyperi]
MRTITRQTEVLDSTVPVQYRCSVLLSLCLCYSTAVGAGHTLASHPSSSHYRCRLYRSTSLPACGTTLLDLFHPAGNISVDLGPSHSSSHLAQNLSSPTVTTTTTYLQPQKRPSFADHHSRSFSQVTR